MAKKTLLIIILFGLILIIIFGLLLSLQLNPAKFKVEIGINGFSQNLPLEDKAVLTELQNSLFRFQAADNFKFYLLSQRSLSLTAGQKTEEFYFLNSCLIHKNKPLLVELSPEAASSLKKQFKILGSNLYAEDLSWAEADKLLPRNEYAEITDFETGLSFRIKRRAGTYHADVQPLTPQDTMIMKKIYGSQWSWRRRAVIVQIGNRYLAASINGMPHGAGTIRGNNFPGHFCLHFRGSKVHKSRVEDLGHRLMILKAAGKLEDAVGQAVPRELIAIFYTSLKNHDWDMASLALSFTNPAEISAVAKNLSQIEDIKTFTAEVDESYSGTVLEVPITLAWRRPQENTFTTSKLVLKISKDQLLNRWFIQALSVKLPEN